jgi:NMD protein affecting ribosome stability and mRNA decay
MVAADILEGCADGIQVKYCRRCGSIKTDWMPQTLGGRFISLDHTWRRPDPFLWVG